MQKQSFDLKYYGGYDIFEQNNLSAEERKWIIEELNRVKEAENKVKGG